jgi:hypothetical protein
MRFEYGEKSRICFEKRQARAWARIALAFVVAGASGLAWADGEAAGSELQWTVGARFWVADWSSWAIKRSSADYVVQAHADTRLAVIPLMSVQYGKASVSLSSLLGTQYKLAAPSSDDHAYQLNAKRSEFDLNAGYQLLPGLRGILGYKTIQQNFGVNYKWAGPFAGISASSELQGPLGMYGNFSLGRFTLSASSQPSKPGASYVLGEFGLAYGLGPVLGVGQASVTVGYRAQVLRTNGYRATSALTTDVQDTTQGFVAGAYCAF